MYDQLSTAMYAALAAINASRREDGVHRDDRWRVPRPVRAKQRSARVWKSEEGLTDIFIRS